MTAGLGAGRPRTAHPPARRHGANRKRYAENEAACQELTHLFVERIDQLDTNSGRAHAGWLWAHPAGL
jgi:hypothetical protein